MGAVYQLMFVLEHKCWPALQGNNHTEAAFPKSQGYTIVFSMLGLNGKSMVLDKDSIDVWKTFSLHPLCSHTQDLQLA